jgi:hypothetical protein
LIAPRRGAVAGIILHVLLIAARATENLRALHNDYFA